MVKVTKTDMKIQDSKLSRMLLNDTKELLKKHSIYGTTGYSRRLFSKLNKSPTSAKVPSISSYYKKYMTRSKRPGHQLTPKISKKNDGWKKEYDIWNMIVQAFDKSVLNNNQQFDWPMNEIAVRDSNNNIRLIQNRHELNEQILVSSNGSTHQITDVINPNDSTENVSLKIKYKLVPVIEFLTVVKNSTEISYEFDENVQDINNNNMECVSDKENEKELKVEKTLTPDQEIYNGCYFQNTMDATCDPTAVNMSALTWEYSDFCGDIPPGAQSSIIEDEKENNPFVAKKRRFSTSSRTFRDSPMPNFAKKRAIQNEFRGNSVDFTEMMKACKDIKLSLQGMLIKVNWIEEKFMQLEMKREETYYSISKSDFSISGIEFLSDSIEI